ncbi:MAG TPA: ChbG/HpnK family deacetylase [Clostridiales bacterium]|nr:ChbG/HpnK family deacetylase [Clostridiales bacterium]
MKKFLIINADDCGMCHAANMATFDLFEKGGITSATIMTPCGWAPEALAYAKAHPEFAFGTHLTFTSEWKKYRWRPISRTCTDSLRDEYGLMHFHCDGFEANAKADEVEAEIRAQIKFMQDLGVEPSHIDNHMGSLYGLEGFQNFLPLVLKICAELGYAFRLPRKSHEERPAEFIEHLEKMCAIADEFNVPIIDYLWVHNFKGPQSESYESFRDYMYTRFENCPEGIVETYIHPAVECDELKNTSSLWRNRVWEYQLFADPATRKHIEQNNIKLISYRDLAAARAELAAE